jgi:hypothetical protein
MLDNVTVAIFTKLNELAERYGLKPYDFVATQRDGVGSNVVLDFEVPPTGNVRIEELYDQMLRALGIPADGHSLQGSLQQIIDKLDAALHMAPQVTPQWRLRT